MTIPVERLYTFKEVAEHFGVSESTVSRYVKTGAIKATNIAVMGRRDRISESSLVAFIRARTA